MISLFAFVSAASAQTVTSTISNESGTQTSVQAPSSTIPYRITSDEEIRSKVSVKTISGNLQSNNSYVKFKFEVDGRFIASNGGPNGKWSIQDGLLRLEDPTWPFPDNRSQVWIQTNGKIQIGRWFKETW